MHPCLRALRMCGMRTLVTVVTLFLLSAATATSNDDNVVHARDGGPAPQENCVKLSSYAIQSGSGFPTYTQARPSIQLDVAECAKSNQASVDDGRMHVPLKLIFDGQELETSTITLPTGGAGTFQGEESWMKRRLWLPDIGGVHDLEVVVETPVPQHLYFVYEKLQASAKPYISFPPPNGSYIFGRSTSPFVKVGVSGVHCSSDRLDNSTGDCWATYPTYSVSLNVNPADKSSCMKWGWADGGRRCDVIRNDDSSMCDTVKYGGVRIEEAQYLGLSCLAGGTHNVSVFFWDAYGALMGELWAMLRVNMTHTGGGGVVHRGEDASFLDIVSKHMGSIDSTRPAFGKATEFAFEAFSRTVTCEVRDGAVIVDVDRALKGERGALRLLEALVEGVAQAASKQWCLSLSSVPQEFLSRLASFGPASEVNAMSQDSEGGGDGGAGGNVLSVDGTGVWRAVDELARPASGDDGALGDGFPSRANPNNAEGLGNNFWRGQVVGFALTPGRLLEAELAARGFGAWGWRGRSIVFGVHITAQTSKDQVRQALTTAHHYRQDEDRRDTVTVLLVGPGSGLWGEAVEGTHRVLVQEGEGLAELHMLARSNFLCLSACDAFSKLAFAAGSYIRSRGTGTDSSQGIWAMLMDGGDEGECRNWFPEAGGGVGSSVTD